MEKLTSSELLDKVFDVDFLKFVEMCEAALGKDVVFDEFDSSFYVFSRGAGDSNFWTCTECHTVNKSSKYTHCVKCRSYNMYYGYTSRLKEIIEAGIKHGCGYLEEGYR